MASNLTKVIERSFSDVIQSEILFHFGNKTPKSIKLISVSNANFNNEKINFDIKVDVKYEKKQTVYLQCECTMDTIIRNFKVVNVAIDEPEIRLLEDAVLCSSNLVPNIKKKEYESEAKAFLNCYFPDGLKSCLNIPIKEIATTHLGFTINMDYKIESLGMICLNDGFVNTDQGRVLVKANTILIDRDLIKERGIGCFNNTLAHELYHYFRHRYYFWLRALAFNDEYFNYSIKSNNRYSDSNKVEYDANQIAPKILMPTHSFMSYVWDRQMEYNYLFSFNKSEVMRDIVEDSASFFGTSRKSTAIRISEVGIFIDKNDLNYYNDLKETTEITNDEFTEIYNTDNNLRTLIDNGTFVYTDNHVVYNHERFTNDNHITFYAEHNPNECMITFTRTKDYQVVFNSSALGRKSLKDKLYMSLKHNKALFEKLKKFNIDKILEEDKYKDFIKPDIDETIRELIEYKGITQDEIAILSDVRKGDINAIIHGESDIITPEKALKILHALEVPKRYTKKALSNMTENFDKSMKTRLLEEVIDTYYELVGFDFNEKVKEAVELSKEIDESKPEQYNSYVENFAYKKNER